MPRLGLALLMVLVLQQPMLILALVQLVPLLLVPLLLVPLLLVPLLLVPLLLVPLLLVPLLLVPLLLVPLLLVPLLLVPLLLVPLLLVPLLLVPLLPSPLLLALLARALAHLAHLALCLPVQWAVARVQTAPCPVVLQALALLLCFARQWVALAQYLPLLLLEKIDLLLRLLRLLRRLAGWGRQKALAAAQRQIF